MFSNLPNLLGNKKVIGEDLFLKHSEDKLSKRRLGRITGSQVGRISVIERKATGSRKDDLLAWIIDQPTGLEELSNICYLFEKSSYDKLTLEQIRTVYNQFPGQLELTQGAETYLDELISEITTGQEKFNFNSSATDWGKKYEPESIIIFQDYLLDLNPNITFKRNEFFIHPKNNLVGCTNDLSVYDLTVQESPIAVVENKCPYVSSNHTRCIRKDEHDDQYDEQMILELLCSGADTIYFVSYDPRQQRKENKQYIKKITRQDFSGQILKLETALDFFCKIYRKEAARFIGSLDSFMFDLDKNND